MTVDMFFEQGADLRILGSWKLQGVSEVSVDLNRSFGALVLVVSEGGRRSISVDGADWPVRLTNGDSYARIPLENDLVSKRILVFEDVESYLTINLLAQHEYVSPTLSIRKWAFEDFDREAKRYQRLVGDGRLARFESGIAAKVGLETPNAMRAAIGHALEVLALVRDSSASDLAKDFPIRDSKRINRDATLSRIKADVRFLSEVPNGLIKFRGRTYSVPMPSYEMDTARRFDVSPIADIVDNCRGLVSSVPSASVLTEILRRASDEIGSAVASSGRIAEDPTSRRMDTQAGREIQDELLRLVAACSSLAVTSLESERRDRLRMSVRDFEAYELSAWAACGFACGFGYDEIVSADGVLARGELTLANCNTSTGLKVLAETLVSWRETTLQPSGYRPDFLIRKGSRRLIVDAKFRISSALGVLGPASGLKDLQAYLDDFSMSSAIAIVPNVPGGRDRAILESGSKRVDVVRVTDSQDSASLAILWQSIRECLEFDLA